MKDELTRVGQHRNSLYQLTLKLQEKRDFALSQGKTWKANELDEYLKVILPVKNFLCDISQQMATILDKVPQDGNSEIMRAFFLFTNPGQWVDYDTESVEVVDDSRIRGVVVTFETDAKVVLNIKTE